MPSCHNLPEHLWSKIILLEMKAPLDQLGWQALSDIYPQNSAVLLNYADQLLLAHQSEKVVQLLTPVADQFNERWEFWKRIAQAWNQQNDNASEAFAMAKAYSSIGALKLAEIQIDRAKKSADASNNIQLNTQRENLENWLKIQLKARKEL
jgi:predicted Zn-dependent protease